MKYGKIMIMLVLAIFIFGVASVCASDMNDTVIANDDISQIGLSADNEVDADNFETHDEKNVLSQGDNDESISAENDLQVLGTDIGNYSGLTSEIRNGGNVELKHDYYRYDSGSTIEIDVDNTVIDGKGAVIDMTGSSNMKAFYVSASGVTFKNLNIKNANFGDGEGGAIYFCNYATVTNCNFTANHAKNGGAVYFADTGDVSNCNFTANTATDDGGAVFFNLQNGNVVNCNFNGNFAYGDGGAILSQFYQGVTADTCIFKTASDTTYNTRNLAPILNVDSFTSVYGSGDKVTFDLKTNSSIPVTDGNISISVYFKDNDTWLVITVV